MKRLFTSIEIDGRIYRECSGCKELKFLDEFGNNHIKPLGKAHYCLECFRAIDAKRRLRAGKAANSAATRKHLLNTYNLTLEDFNNMLEHQHYKCAICPAPVGVGPSWQTHIDHCHKTGKVRGILCNNCNFGLGSFKDNIKTLQNAAEYLAKHQGHISPKSLEYYGMSPTISRSTQNTIKYFARGR